MKTAFIDLDGTLIDGNSMKIFMKWLPLRLTAKRRPIDALIASLWIFLRAARLTSHSRMKWNLTKIARNSLTPSDWNEISERIICRINPEVDRYVTYRKNEGDKICIATAAPEEYAEIIAKKYGAEFFLATAFNSDFSDYSENNGATKLKSIRRLIKDNGLDMSVFLTDHFDDLPTMKAFPGKTLLVRPSDRTLNLCTEEQILK